MRSLLKDINRYFGSKSLKRKALTKPNIIYFRWRYVSNRDRTFRAWLHRPVYADSPALAEELKRRGIVIGPSYLFLDRDGQEALAQASAVVLDLSRRDDVQARIWVALSGDRKDYVLHLVPYDQEHAPDSPLLHLALNRKLLEIVSLYLGMWPRLNLISAWLNYPTKDAPKESQLWHRDPEDLKIIKAFIYLNDVDEKGGPFCYIPTTHPFGAGAARVPTQIDPNRISDDEMRATIPEESWLACTGPANTMILADTIGYHRGGKPRVGNRILITFTYTSGAPVVKRTLNISSDAGWITHAMQRYALAK